MIALNTDIPNLTIETPADRVALMSLIYLKDHMEEFRETLDVVKYSRLIARSILDIEM
jgi:hypothetical protein